MIYSIFIFLMFLFLLLPSVSAHCPLCSAATGAAVAVTRFYGIDDLIVGLFIGAFIISTALWFNKWLLKKNNAKNYFPAQGFVLIIVFLGLTILTFYFARLLGNQKFFGVDRLVAGTLLGNIITPLGFLLSNKIKKARGKAFPFQSIILPLALLAVVAIIFYFVA